ncbi:MAG: hypothetical protein KAS32_13435 [Candidatus Peribacteraceae bacterium]|nr:hypothetical protein [Candidatus Peribacteraceae bacterium]
MSEQALNEMIENANDELNSAMASNDQEGIQRMEAHLDDLHNELSEFHRVND